MEMCAQKYVFIYGILAWLQMLWQIGYRFSSVCGFLEWYAVVLQSDLCMWIFSVNTRLGIGIKLVCVWWGRLSWGGSSHAHWVLWPLFRVKPASWIWALECNDCGQSQYVPEHQLWGCGGAIVGRATASIPRLCGFSRASGGATVRDRLVAQSRPPWGRILLVSLEHRRPFHRCVSQQAQGLISLLEARQMSTSLFLRLGQQVDQFCYIWLGNHIQPSGSEMSP